jgi:hypothetical protein
MRENDQMGLLIKPNKPWEYWRKDIELEQGDKKMKCCRG